MEKVLNPTLRSRLGIETLSSKHLLEIAKSEMKKIATKTSATNGDHSAVMAEISWLARWLQCMHRCLDQERDSSQETLDSISSLDVIPLTGGSCVNLKGDSIFLPLSMNQNLSGTVQQKKKSSPSKLCLPSSATVSLGVGGGSVCAHNQLLIANLGINGENAASFD